jgi:SPP1 gp7 family putative phage head morphogenesis protein
MAAADDAADELIQAALDSTRAVSGIAKDMRASLQELADDLSDLVMRHETESIKSMGKLRQLLAQVKALVRESYDLTAEQTAKKLAQFSAAELDHGAAAINVQLGADLANLKITFEQVKQLSDQALARGRFFKELMGDAGVRLTNKVTAQIRMGIVGGETNDQIISRIRGTKAMSYKDGVMEATKREAETIVRTAASAAGNAARAEVYDQNMDLIKGFQHLSTLDSRTSDICIARSGVMWDADKEPVGDNPFPYEDPPLHPNCRSVILPILKSFGELATTKSKFSDRKKKALYEDRLRQKLEDLGLSDAEIEKEMVARRASMDGSVAADLSFDDFLKGKSQAFQDETLGPGRADLWRAGKISLTDLVNRNNDPLTLDELTAKARRRKTRE